MSIAYVPDTAPLLSGAPTQPRFLQWQGFL